MKRIVKRIVAGAACVAVLMMAVPVYTAITHDTGNVGIMAASFNPDG